MSCSKLKFVYGHKQIAMGKRRGSSERVMEGR